MQKIKNVFFHWLPLGGAIILLSGLSFLGVQQIHRSLMNDPQVSIVRDAVIKLESGKQPVEVVGHGPDMNEKIDLEKSLSPFIGVYDKDGTPLEINAVLGNYPPKPPVGIFEFAKANGEHKVSWQPNSNTRIALVVRPVNNGSGWYVASGRNMIEDEKRIQSISKLYGCTVLFILIITFVLDLISDAYRRRVMSKN